jgi:O-antigen ligase
MKDIQNGLSVRQGRGIEFFASLVAEYGIYLYVFWLMFDKGEGLRNLGLYSAFAGWVILVLSRKKSFFSLDIVTLFFLLYLASTALSTIFSIDPLYSFIALKKDVLKAAITFFVISTFFHDGMLMRMGRVYCAAGLAFLAFGIHNFLFSGNGVYTSDNMFLSADKNQYGFYLCLVTPFFFLFMMKTRYGWRRLLWGMASLWGIAATFFSASRGAMANMFTVVTIYSGFLIKRKNMKSAVTVVSVCVVLAIFSFRYLPEPLKFRLLSTPQHLSTFDERTYLFWGPAFDAVKKRPLLGWGYGKKLARDPRPFQGGEMPDLSKKGQLHSSFITNLFHQGLFGLLSYLFMLLSTGFVLFRLVRSEDGDRKLLALILLGIIIGSFFVNSFVRTVAFRRLAVILAMSAALYKNSLNTPKDT